MLVCMLPLHVQVLIFFLVEDCGDNNVDIDSENFPYKCCRVNGCGMSSCKVLCAFKFYEIFADDYVASTPTPTPTPTPGPTPTPHPPAPRPPTPSSSIDGDSAAIAALFGFVVCIFALTKAEFDFRVFHL